MNTATPIRAVTRHADGVAIRDDADDVCIGATGSSSPPTRTRRCGC